MRIKIEELEFKQLNSNELKKHPTDTENLD
jgi:hypothetical protein